MEVLASRGSTWIAARAALRMDYEQDHIEMEACARYACVLRLFSAPIAGAISSECVCASGRNHGVPRRHADRWHRENPQEEHVHCRARRADRDNRAGFRTYSSGRQQSGGCYRALCAAWAHQHAHSYCDRHNPRRGAQAYAPGPLQRRDGRARHGRRHTAARGACPCISFGRGGRPGYLLRSFDGRPELFQG